MPEDPAVAQAGYLALRVGHRGPARPGHHPGRNPLALHLRPAGPPHREAPLGADGDTFVERVDFTWDGTTLCEQTTRAAGLPNPVTLTWDHQGLKPIAQTERTTAADAPQKEIDSRFFAIVTDLVGSPRELVDEHGDIAWRPPPPSGAPPPTPRSASPASTAPAESAPPVLAAFTVDVAEGSPAAYAQRVRHVLSAALHLAGTAEFDDEDLPADEFPDWFTAISARDGETHQEFARDGRTAYTNRSGGNPWSLQNWIYRFDPDEDSRGWEFWDVVPVGPSQVHVWVDSWGESFFGSLDLLWLLYTAGAAHAEGPENRKASMWASEARGR